MNTLKQRGGIVFYSRVEQINEKKQCTAMWEEKAQLWTLNVTEVLYENSKLCIPWKTFCIEISIEYTKGEWGGDTVEYY